jgi:hypothetical protein
MLMNPPTVPPNFVNAVPYEDLVLALRLIHHATKPEPADGGYHEAAFELCDSIVKRLDARAAYERALEGK